MIYIIDDFITTSEMERKRNNYRDLVESLNDDIQYIEKKLEHLLSYRETEKTIMAGNYDDASGILVNKYDYKLEEFNGDTQRLILYFQIKLDNVKFRLTRAQEKLSYYEEQCRLEDQMEQEIRE